MFLSNEIRKTAAKKGRCLVSIIGGGGKTTTLYALAHQLKQEHPVVITSTTAMMAPDLTDVTFLEFSKALSHLPLPGETCAWYDRRDEDIAGKVRGVSPEAIDKLMHTSEGLIVLNEADGAARRPLKAPADHEPVIPNASDIVLVVIGLDALFKPAGSEWVHREALYYERTNSAVGDVISPSNINLLMHHPKGLLKNVPSTSDVYMVLNKESCLEGVFHLTEFVRGLPKRISGVVVADMEKGEETVVIRRM